MELMKYVFSRGEGKLLMETLIILAICGILAVVFIAAGRIVGRKVSFAWRMGRWGPPAVLILALFFHLLWQRELFPLSRLHMPNFYELIIWGELPVALSLTSLGLSLFRPSRSVYRFVLLTGMLGLVHTVLQYEVMRVFRDFFLWAISLKGVCYLALLFLAGIGAASCFQKSKQPQVQMAGKLSLLTASYAGEQISLPDGEEFRLGNDVTDCHLLFELSGEPRCLCRVCWNKDENCYYVTNCDSLGLLYENGCPVQEGVVVKVPRGSTFLDGQTGQKLFRLE